MCHPGPSPACGPLLLAALLSMTPPSASALLGGQPDKAAAYESVVALSVGDRLHCSATKIAPRAFLLAAHCIASTRTGGLDEAFEPGRRIQVSNRRVPRSLADFQSLGVEQGLLHPDYERALKRLFAYQEARRRDYRERYSGLDLERRLRVLEANSHFTSRFPDLAILVVREESRSIPIAGVDCRPLHAGDEVILVGYGIESLTRTAELRRRLPFGRRRWARAQVIRVDPVNFYSYGGLMREGAPSLSPGDSGGPVIRRGRVVGVHGTVYGLSRLDKARSNMSVNLAGLGAGGEAATGCRAFIDEGLHAGR